MGDAEERRATAFHGSSPSTRPARRGPARRPRDRRRRGRTAPRAASLPCPGRWCSTAQSARAARHQSGEAHGSPPRGGRRPTGCRPPSGARPAGRSTWASARSLEDGATRWSISSGVAARRPSGGAVRFGPVDRDRHGPGGTGGCRACAASSSTLRRASATLDPSAAGPGRAGVAAVGTGGELIPTMSWMARAFTDCEHRPEGVDELVGG